MALPVAMWVTARALPKLWRNKQHGFAVVSLQEQSYVVSAP
jgi:hypothetical protein